MFFIILFLPLLNAVLVGFFGRFFGMRGSVIFTICSIIICCFFSIFCFYLTVIEGSVFSFTICHWIHSGLLVVNWGFLFDSLTSVILIIVSIVSCIVHFYSSSYIIADPHLSRFISYLSFFTFFIFILVSADNFVQMFVGWEGVGLCSFLLINFWFTRIQANKAAIKAMLVNRVGDFGLALGIFSIFYKFGAVDYFTVFSLVPFILNSYFIFFGFKIFFVNVVTFFLFVGAAGKSAQLGLHTWLPDAMEGPTPVSALIHAATIVTAGVFLLVRCSSLFEFAPSILWLISIFGGLTSFFAATTGLFQNDLKKVIAYSTCSQLGYIIFSCGISSYSVAVFHLANHAFFKALLFLTAGCVIHSFRDEQDIRKIGGLIYLLPFSYCIILIGSLALIGFPFLSGFYSKEIILEFSYAGFSTVSHFCYFLGVVAAFFTAFYSARSLHLTFLAFPRGFKFNYEQSHESSLVISFSLFLLCFGSIFFGYFAKDIIIGYGSHFFVSSVFIFPSHFFIAESEFLPLLIKLVPFVFSMFGLFFGFLVCNFFIDDVFKIKKIYFGQLFYIFFNKKWLFDRIYNEFVSISYLNFSYLNFYKQLDKGFFEIFGPFGLSFVVYQKSKKISKLQSGLIFHYLFLMMFFFICFVTFLGFSFYNSLFDFRLFVIFLIFTFCLVGKS